MILAAFRQGNKLSVWKRGERGRRATYRVRVRRPIRVSARGLPAISLGVNGSCLTAIGNDYGFEHTFSRQVEALGRPGDVAIGISTSGNSTNILCALATAKKMKLLTIALTGKTGGKLKDSGDVECCICAPTDETPRVQECHILIGHVICEIVEQELFDEKGRVPGS